MSRASEINHRLVDIANGEAERIFCEVHNRESPKQTCVVGIDWSFGLDGLVEIVQCFRGESLAIICKVTSHGAGVSATRWRHSRSIPVEHRNKGDLLTLSPS